MLDSVGINFGYVLNKYKFLYIFGEVPVVPAITERCRWICKYVQYSHLSCYDSD